MLTSTEQHSVKAGLTRANLATYADVADERVMPALCGFSGSPAGRSFNVAHASPGEDMHVRIRKLDQQRLDDIGAKTAELVVVSGALDHTGRRERSARLTCNSGGAA